jgi:hypothetical protein
MHYIVYVLITTIMLTACHDTGCRYERYIQLERDSQGIVRYLDCVEETCPGLLPKKTCYQRG